MTTNELKKSLRIGNFVVDAEDGRRMQITLGSQIDMAHLILPIPITEEKLIQLGFNKHLSYWIEVSKDKQFSVAWNDVGVWYAFFTNRNSGQMDDLVCLKNDLMYIHEVQNLVYDISKIELNFNN